jgi:hypothetical protein
MSSEESFQINGYVPNTAKGLLQAQIITCPKGLIIMFHPPGKVKTQPHSQGIVKLVVLQFIHQDGNTQFTASHSSINQSLFGL